MAKKKPYTRKMMKTYASDFAYTLRETVKDELLMQAFDVVVAAETRVGRGLDDNEYDDIYEELEDRMHRVLKSDLVDDLAEEMTQRLKDYLDERHDVYERRNSV